MLPKKLYIYSVIIFENGTKTKINTKIFRCSENKLESLEDIKTTLELYEDFIFEVSNVEEYVLSE